MADIGLDIAHRREPDHIIEGKIRKPGPNDTSMNWFGEVSDVCVTLNLIVKAVELTDSNSSDWTAAWKLLYQTA
jgi:ubiquitin-conjugating enzyme E2 O